MSFDCQKKKKLSICEEFLHQLDKGIFLSNDSLNEMLSLLNNDVNNEIDVNITNRWRYTALMIACVNRHIELLNKLIERKADIHYHNKLSNSLIQASDYQHLDVINILLSNGIDVNFKSEKNVFALFIAVRMGNIETANLLLLNNADVTMEYTNSENNTVMTNTSIAISKMRYDISNLLRDHGVN